MKVEKNIIKCNKCHGLGKIDHEWKKHIVVNHFYDFSQKCDKCEGTGKRTNKKVEM